MPKILTDKNFLIGVAVGAFVVPYAINFVKMRRRPAAAPVV